MDGGFYPVISCNIGSMEISKAFRQVPEAVSVVQSNISNKFITVVVDDDVYLRCLFDIQKQTIFQWQPCRWEGTRSGDPETFCKMSQKKEQYNFCRY